MTVELIFKKPAGFSFVFINSDIPENIKIALDTELSYTIQNAEYAIEGYNEKALAKWAQKVVDAHRRGIPEPKKPEPWDGKVRFFNLSKSGSYFFPIGLLPRVMKLLKWYDVAIKTDLHYNDDTSEGEFTWTGPELRDYQMESLEKLIANKGGVASMPTASGKTVVMLRLIYAMSTQTLVLVHRKELFKQWCSEIEKNIGNVVPMDLSDAIRQYTIQTDDNIERPKIVIAMIPTLSGADRNRNIVAQGVMGMKFNLCCVDECHHVPSETFYSVVNRIDANFKTGLSATTEREDGETMKMEAALGPICVNVKAEELIDREFISRPMFEFIDVDAGARGKTFAEVYKNGIVFNESRNNAIDARVKRLVSDGRQVLVCVEHINHGKLLSQLMGVPFVYSKSKDRSETIGTFERGLTKVLITTLLNEGFNLPKISAVVLAGGRKTEAGTIQKVGRALRPDENFKTAIVVDFADKGKFLSEHTLSRYNAYIKFYGEDIVRGFTKKETLNNTPV